MSVNASVPTPAISSSKWIAKTSNEERGLLVAKTVKLIRDIVTKAQKDVEEAALTYPGNRKPLAVVEGPAQAAKSYVDSKLQHLLADAVLPVDVRRQRQAFQYMATGQRNIFDVFDPVERKAAGMEIDPGAAYRLVINRETVAEKLREAGLLPEDPAWPEFMNKVRKEIFSDQQMVRLLTLMDQFHFARTRTGELWIGTIAWDFPGMPPGFGVRHLRWKSFFVTVHEYLHTLEHPVFTAASTFNSAVMVEGFCESLARDLRREFQQQAEDPRYDDIRRMVEGVAPDQPAPTVDEVIMDTDWNSPLYEDDVKLINSLTMYGTPIPRRRRWAAFLQGHVEYYNLTPDGVPIADAPDALVDDIAVPRTCRSLTDLVKFTGVTAERLAAANLDPLPSRLAVPGWQEHRVVTVSEPDGTSLTETIAQIAGQHGLTPERVRQVNGLDPQAEPRPGAVILVPSTS